MTMIPHYVTWHAVVRYLERIQGVNVDSYRQAAVAVLPDASDCDIVGAMVADGVDILEAIAVLDHAIVREARMVGASAVQIRDVTVVLSETGTVVTCALRGSRKYMASVLNNSGWANRDDAYRQRNGRPSRHRARRSRILLSMEVAND